MSTAIKTFKKFSFLFIILTTLVVGACLTAVITFADTFYTVRIEYKFKDGTPAHDAYVAAYRAGENVDTTVTNPDITGFTPMTATEGGTAALTTELKYDDLSENHNITVYYIAGLTKYRAMYYKQNIYDDLYTRDNTVDVRYTDRYGLTGTNPTELEGEANKPEGYEGFTNLFHEPDAIAADGSTVFRVYYDRNYYTVNFDLGEGGYGVDTVYAKYESVYHIGEPKRPGFTFKGWVRTNKDGDKFYDENDVEISESQCLAKAFEHHNGTVPAGNVYYKAVWEATTTEYSIVYWMENPDSTTSLEEMQAQTNQAALRTIVTRNYSVAATKTIENVSSDTEVNYEEMIRDYDFFYTNVANKTNRNLSTEFPEMSDAKLYDLNGQGRFFELDEFLTKKNFKDDLPTKSETLPNISIAGDGTTRINVYYDRKEFTMKFFYARQKISDGTIDLTNSTKGFSREKYTGMNYMQAVAKGTWQANIADSLPHIKDKYLVENGGPLTELSVNYSGYTYYYYQLSAKYNEPLKGKWILDPVTDVHKKNYADIEMCKSASWAVEYGTKYFHDHNADSQPNYTIKGFYERLGQDLMFRDRTSDYQELHYLVSWTNTSRSDDWNGGISKVLNFKYQSYLELLPKEVVICQNDTENGPDQVKASGGYIDVRTFNTIENGQNVTKWYGLKADQVFDTIDSGNQYPYKTNPNQRSQNDPAIRTNQTAADITGFVLEDKPSKSPFLKTTNTEIDWSEDSQNDRHATIKFFYKRLVFSLTFINGNNKEKKFSDTDSEATDSGVAYGVSFNKVYADGPNAGEYIYKYTPEYPNPDLRDYYEFKGWYYTPYYYREVDFDEQTMPADDVTLYAKWVPKVINVSFYPTYNDYYGDENRIHCIPNPDYDEENPSAEPKWIDGTIPVNYGDYIPHNQIPADVDEDETDLRPNLDPPAEGAQFAGWYYLRDNIPVRFEPENLPVTALNHEASVQNGNLKLFAEWVTKDVAKYQVKYVEKDNPEREVADSTTGRAFVYKTKTFNAKGGSDLNAAHAWEEDGTNWWPTTNSTSIVMKANAQGEEFAPNICTFKYIKKQKVHYKVQYLDAASRKPLLDEKIEESGHASIQEDAPFIPGYAVTEGTKKLVLTASTAATEAKQREEELENNVITFYYNKNNTEYIYEVEYYKQNTNDNNYTLDQKERLPVTIASEGDTTVSLANDIYNRQIPSVFEQNGFTRKAGATTVTEVNGEVNTYSVADNANIVISPAHRSTIKVYFDRNLYNYSYKYVDHTQEKLYNDKLNNGESVDGVWDGIIREFPNQGPERVDKDVIISGERDITYNGTPYTRINNRDITLNIAPVTPSNPKVNEVKIYYKKYTERELQFKLSCKNESSPYTEVDYDQNTGDPLYGGISLPMQTIDSYSDIQSVEFYDFNDAKTSTGGVENYIHQHKYNFLGWFDNPEGTGTPLTTNAILTKEDLGLNESLPERDKNYYAVVEQVLVTANFEFRIVDEDLPIGTGDGETPEDRAAAEILSDPTRARTDVNGDFTGGKFDFSAPSTYQNNTPIPWHRTDGYSMEIIPKDNKVYKYEFAEWWEEDLSTHKLIRKKNWNSSGEWSPTILQNQVIRNGDKHIIAVYKKRAVTEMPYTIKYRFNTRLHGEKDFVVKGTLSGDELTSYINSAGDFQLKDSFIMSKSPFESNHGETLCWKDTNIVKTSETGDSKASNPEEKVDRIITTVTAEQKVKKAYANYRLTSDGEYTTIQTTIGANRSTDTNLAEIDVSDRDDFSYWEIRKSETGNVIARCFEPKFTFCIMDNYYISPVFEGKMTPDSDITDITLKHLDYSRNRWTDDNGNVPSNGTTDELFTDFEISFNNKDDKIFGENTGYKTGVVFELCAQLPADKTFDPDKDYKIVSNEDNLKAKIKSSLDSGTYYTTYAYKTNKNRSIQIKEIPTANLTNKNRVEFGQPYVNKYTVTGTDGEGNEIRSYTNSTYLLKAWAYLIDEDDNVTLSNPVYTCLNDISKKDLATGEVIGDVSLIDDDTTTE